MTKDDTFEFNYFQESEADQFAFYRIPKALFTDDYFKGLTCEAKVAYGLMLDRMCLSRKNGWIDNDGRVYIIFGLDEVAEYLNCGHVKCVKILAELDCKKGIGLIERVRRGLGMPDIIYVKNFVRGKMKTHSIPDEPEERDKRAGSKDENCTSETCECEESALNAEVVEDMSGSEKFTDQTSRSFKNELPEVSKMNFRKFQNRTSECSKNELQEVSKSNPNNTYYNNTYISDNLSSSILSMYRGMGGAPDGAQREGRMDGDLEQFRNCEEKIKANIDYDALVDGMLPAQKKCVDDTVSVMVDVIEGRRDTVLIGGTEYPHQYVVDRLLRVDRLSIQNVVNAVVQNVKDVKNVKSYILACAFNEPVASGSYYKSDSSPLDGKSRCPTTEKRKTIRNKTVNGQFGGFEQRETDYDELEKRLMGTAGKG